MKKVAKISLIILLVIALIGTTAFFIKRHTLTKEVTEYLITEKGYDESEFRTEGFYFKVMGKIKFTIKVVFEDEEDYVFIYGKLDDQIYQVLWLTDRDERPEKHVEENILYER